MIKLDNAIRTGVPNMSILPKIPLKHILDIKEVPCQRDHKIRVNKMNKVFIGNDTNKMIHQFVLFNVTKDLEWNFNGEKVPVNKGLYLADGNTRAESNKRYQSKSDEFKRYTDGYNPSHDVMAVVIDINDSDSLLKEYFGIDNSLATESSTDKMRGAIKSLEMNVVSNKAKSGGFGTALTAAYPGDSKLEPIVKVSYFRNEILLLDKANLWLTAESDLQTQHFYCASLIAAKLYTTNGKEQRDKFLDVMKNLTTLDRYKIKTEKPKWSGVTALIHQLTNPFDKHWYPDHEHKKTGLSSWKPVIGFLLYCFELAMLDKHIDHVKGFKPSNWENYYLDAKANMASIQNPD